MKRLKISVLAGAMLLVTVASAQMPMRGMGRGNGQGMMGGGQEGVSMLRHRYVMSNGLDPSYATQNNPLVASVANVQQGKVLFETNCAVCHGTSGLGDGPAAKALTPVPANLSVAINMPIASDGYLDWTLSEGGVPVQSAMPPFKAVLSSDDIWRVILYLRSL